MVNVTFVDDKGHTTTVEITAGNTVMSGAVANSVEGILAECGGSAMCATCHVYVEERFMKRLPAISDVEEAMLESTAEERKATSRLSCQLVAADEIDGLVVHLPRSQI